MRPMLALYVGGMGSREKNFYNRLVASYGFEAEAKQVQDLYLEGRRAEAMAALPDAMIDMTTIAGSRDHARERLRAYRDAGVDTLIISPMAGDNEDRLKQLRIVAELAQEVEKASARS
jgi:alkanesulfonate monooxygenase SsuD/methylene tetrahydromethanopterin reductase-like flavin-dependent oxidoreductase (luciferase family)